MEQGEVLERVGREVFKAVWLLTNGYDKNYVSESKILSHVEVRVKNLVGTHGLENIIHKCLEYLSDVGLLRCIDSERFSVIRQCRTNSSPRLTQPDILEEFHKLIKSPRKRKYSNMNLRSGEAQISDDQSVTNDESDCTTKRLRTNNDDVLYMADKKPFSKICQVCCDNFLNVIYARSENVDEVDEERRKVEISSQSNLFSIANCGEHQRH
ncbi:hypothetical protein GQX74_002020 [Glossina fuscipes]|nr:hypothetical protein GQX74_002020 [Glossina fuscipes]